MYRAFGGYCTVLEFVVLHREKRLPTETDWWFGAGRDKIKIK